MTAESHIDYLLFERYFAKRPNGRGRVLVEVGAAGPDYLSVGAKFRKAGWRVISVEPNPHFAAAHRSRGHEIFEYAASDRDEDDVEFHLVNLNGLCYENGEITYESISSLGIKNEFREQLNKLAENASLETIKVKTRRLDTILAGAEDAVETIDLLCIDVEGWEMTVLDGLDFDSCVPSVIMLENFGDCDEYRERLSSLGYIMSRRVAFNEIYVKAAELRVLDSE